MINTATCYMVTGITPQYLGVKREANSLQHVVPELGVHALGVEGEDNSRVAEQQVF